ncbi:MAG: transglycosylase domain-containing protein [Bacteroidota bacterium]
MPDTAPAPTQAPPWWRRALAWVWRRIAAVVVWIWTTLKASAGAVWTNVRNTEHPASKRVLWAAGGVAGASGVFAVASGMLLVLYALLLWPFTPSVGDLREVREIDPSVVLSADGVQLTRYARRNREWKTLDEISPHVVDALVATEDRRFYAHGGLDLVGTASIVAGVARGRGLRGGSTLTQQLARNLFPEEVGNHASVTRKVKEAVTALKIERVYTKDEILELYLNTVPFLYNAWGIEMAARTYFSTDAGSLDRLQAATLVGMLKGTSSYNPKRNPERARARRNVVLGQMVKYGDLPEAEAAALAEQPLGLRFERQPMQTSRAPHFTEHVRVRLEDWADRAGYSLYGDGLTIHTTLDWRAQRLAEESVRKFGNALQSVADVEWGRASAARLGTTTAPYVTASRTTQPFERFWTLRRGAADAFIRDAPPYRRAVAAGRDPEAVLDSLRAVPAFLDSLRRHKMRLEVAFTAVEPASGHVRAWVGSRDFARSAYDHVARAKRQPGSTFKPFLYARALEEGFRPDDTLPDVAVNIEMSDGAVWQPTNASGTTTDQEVSLRDALARSTNTVAAQLVQEVGARDLARTARRLGVKSDLDAVPALALGTSEVSLLEMAGAYATIAAGGVRRPPVVVTHITDRDGNEVARFAPDEQKALDDEVAVDLLDMMRGVVDGGTASEVRSAFGARGDLAGKTGTTQDGADGWFLLMHPDLVAGAWVGFDDPRVTFRSAYWGQGGHNALRVVGDFYRAAQRDGLVDTRKAFPRPPEDSDEERGPSLWDRFTDWAGGLLERERDVPEGYGPRTPGRLGDRDRTGDERWVESGWEETLDEWGAALDAEDDWIDPDWIEDQWLDLDRIEDPVVREAARAALRRAVEEANRGASDWRERILDARDEAIDRAQDEAADAARREAERLGLFSTEDVPEADAMTVAPLVPAPPLPEALPGPRTGRERVPEAGGRIEW